jgi:hypothetical protein
VHQPHQGEPPLQELSRPRKVESLALRNLLSLPFGMPFLRASASPKPGDNDARLSVHQAARWASSCSGTT